MCYFELLKKCSYLNSSGGEANIDGAKESEYFCGPSVCGGGGGGTNCYCCAGPVHESCIYGDLATCQRNCHPPEYPRKILQ